MPSLTTIVLLSPLLAAGCVAYVGSDPDSEGGPHRPNPTHPDDDPGDGLADLEGHYRAVCDGSAAVGLDRTHFLALSDNDQVLRVYTRGETAQPAQLQDTSADINIPANAEADFEDALRFGNRIYAIGSHGRKDDGTRDRNRHRFVELELSGDAPATTYRVLGRSERLLDDMLDATTWTTPDPATIDALKQASQLDRDKVDNLAPKLDGINIEGLARAPVAGLPERFVIGLRNPHPNNRAIVVSLTNPSATVTGSRPRFGEAMQLDLGGLAIRGMAYSDALATVLVLAGPSSDGDGPFRLYRWAGTADAQPVLETQLASPPSMRPEAIVTYPDTTDVQILFDGDNAAIGGTRCNEAPAGSREFRDLILHLE